MTIRAMGGADLRKWANGLIHSVAKLLVKERYKKCDPKVIAGLLEDALALLKWAEEGGVHCRYGSEMWQTVKRVRIAVKTAFGSGNADQ